MRLYFSPVVALVVRSYCTAVAAAAAASAVVIIAVARYFCFCLCWCCCCCCCCRYCSLCYWLLTIWLLLLPSKVEPVAAAVACRRKASKFSRFPKFPYTNEQSLINFSILLSRPCFPALRMRSRTFRTWRGRPSSSTGCSTGTTRNRANKKYFLRHKASYPCFLPTKIRNMPCICLCEIEILAKCSSIEGIVHGSLFTIKSNVLL